MIKLIASIVIVVFLATAISQAAELSAAQKKAIAEQFRMGPARLFFS